MNINARTVENARQTMKKAIAEYREIQRSALESMETMLVTTQTPLTAREISEKIGLSTSEIGNVLAYKRFFDQNYEVSQKVTTKRYCLLTDEGPDITQVIEVRRTQNAYKKK